jgi:hypothetical protein
VAGAGGGRTGRRRPCREEDKAEKLHGQVERVVGRLTARLSSVTLPIGDPEETGFPYTRYWITNKGRVIA